LSRSRREIAPKKLIAIFVEGETEKAYFEELRQRKNLGNVSVKVEKFTGVGDYVDKVSHQLRKSSKFVNKDVVQTYLVFDANHESVDNLRAVLDKAASKGFKVAFSNVSFEVWLLCHYRCMGAGVLAESVLNKYLSEELGIPYKKGDSNQISRIMENFDIAFLNVGHINAVSLEKQSTNVGEIILELLT
jgi:hypothetical protein